MKHLLAAVAMVGVTLAAGCEPVKQRIIVHEDGRVEMGVTFILPDDKEQLEKAAELGVPVTEGQAKAFFDERQVLAEDTGVDGEEIDTLFGLFSASVEDVVVSKLFN